MISDEELQKIYKDAQSDESLLSTIDANELLLAYENHNNSYLDGKTSADIAHEIASSFELLKETFTVPNMLKKEMALSLTGYRFIDEIDLLHVGKYTRWIQKYTASRKPALANGGFLTNIEHGDTGIYLKIRLYNNKIINVAFDNCLLYQKMGVGEQLVLLVADYVEK
jgi:hypothetical protein